MSITSEEEFAGLSAAGHVVWLALQAMMRAVRPGITTGDLDEVGRKVISENGGVSAPQKIYDFPGTSCISVNDEAVHGIPGRRVLYEGDLVKLDVTVEKRGFVADAARTIEVGRVTNGAH